MEINQCQCLPFMVCVICSWDSYELIIAKIYMYYVNVFDLIIRDSLRTRSQSIGLHQNFSIMLIYSQFAFIRWVVVLLARKSYNGKMCLKKKKRKTHRMQNLIYFYWFFAFSYCLSLMNGRFSRLNVSTGYLQEREMALRTLPVDVV